MNPSLPSIPRQLSIHQIQLIPRFGAIKSRLARKNCKLVPASESGPTGRSDRSGIFGPVGPTGRVTSELMWTGRFDRSPGDLKKISKISSSSTKSSDRSARPVGKKQSDCKNSRKIRLSMGNFRQVEPTCRTRTDRSDGKSDRSGGYRNASQGLGQWNLLSIKVCKQTHDIYTWNDDVCSS